ncbi:MAG: amidohydrolase [Candidatus Kapabacteria bacterium]|nr:amidohydrolase [Candidatus Kapabacteria bacterium]
MKLLLALLATVLTVVPARAGDEIPGAAQATPIAITNATVHTVTKGTLERATIVFDKGVITAVGPTSSVVVPGGARVIDGTGKHVYPGFIAPSTTIGLTEVDAVRSTRDMAEVGDVNPNARAETAYNPDSEIIPTIRYNGILLANVLPQGGIVSGLASLMRLDGWTREDIAVLPRSAIVLNWPSMDVITAWWMRESPEEQRKASEEAIRTIYDLFTEARAYAALSAVDSSKRDVRHDEFRRVFTDKLPVIVSASSRRQIEAVLNFAKAFGIRVILNGATEAPYMLAEIKAAGVSVIVQRVHSLPSAAEAPYDEAFTLPSKLAAAGIPFAFSEGGAWQQRNLPFNAGTAVAFGLSEQIAERALTIEPATMLGVQAQYGSLEVGKSATLFVSAGNALDGLTNKLEAAFIDGRTVDLSNRHVKLTKKYRERYTR